MSALLTQDIEHSPHHFGTVHGNSGEWPLSMRNEATDNAIKSAGPVRTAPYPGDVITWPSNHKASGSGQRPTAPAFAWLNRWFERPCTIPSPLNEF